MSGSITFNQIYTSYYQRALLFTQSYVLDEPTAEDIVAESFIKLWQFMKEDAVDEEHIGPLLMTILKNFSINQLKHDQIRITAHAEITDSQLRDIELRIGGLESCDPSKIFSEEIRVIVNRTLQSVSPQSRRAFLMSRRQGKSNQVIAEELNISIKAVEYHITKVLKLLREELKDYLPLYYFFFLYAGSNL